MGVPQFFTWLRKTHKWAVKYSLTKGLKIDILYLDLNAILHPVAQKTFGYAGFPRNELADMDTFRTALFATIQHIVDIVKPKEIRSASDGVPPHAKCMQQRFRRFSHNVAKDTQLGHSSKCAFDPNTINPGTAFMDEVDAFMESADFGVPLTHSSHRTQGEGEHKMMDEMRADPDYFAQRNVVIYGNDADLIILGMLRSKKTKGQAGNLIIMKDFTSHKKDADGKYIVASEKVRFNYVNTGQVAKIVDIPVTDFALITFTVGNDFLYPLPDNLHLIATMNYVINLYKNKSKPLRITSGSKILWNNYRLLINDMMLNYSKMWNVDRYAWNNALDNPVKVIQDMEAEDSTTFSAEVFARKWNAAVFKSSVATVVQKWMEGMQWTMLYYVDGLQAANVEWFYPYFYSPPLATIHRAFWGRKEAINVQDAYACEDSKMFTPTQQKCAVMPLHSLVRLVSCEVYNLCVEHMSDLYPDKSILDMQGVNNPGSSKKVAPHYTARTILSFYSPKRVMRVLENVK